MKEDVCYRVLESTKLEKIFVLDTKYGRGSRRGGRNRKTVTNHSTAMVYSGHEGRGCWYGVSRTELR